MISGCFRLLQGGSFSVCFELCNLWIWKWPWKKEELAWVNSGKYKNWVGKYWGGTSWALEVVRVPSMKPDLAFGGVSASLWLRDLLPCQSWTARSYLVPVLPHGSSLKSLICEVHFDHLHSFLAVVFLNNLSDFFSPHAFSEVTLSLCKHLYWLWYFFGRILIWKWLERIIHWKCCSQWFFPFPVENVFLH